MVVKRKLKGNSIYNSYFSCFVLCLTTYNQEYEVNSKSVKEVFTTCVDIIDSIEV